jgi:hypothetical protein
MAGRGLLVTALSVKEKLLVTGQKMLGIQWHWENLNPPQETPAMVGSLSENVDPTKVKGNQNPALADMFEMSVQELKAEISDLKNQKDRQEEAMQTNIKKIHAENEKLRSKIVELKYHETENDQKLKKLEEYLDSLKSKFDDRENEEVEEVDDQEEPGIALEDQLRITEQSAKAIDLLSNHLLSTVWQPCSKNTFGNAVN